jgi:uncharacterized FAD-dependent dehydrogenase
MIEQMRHRIEELGGEIRFQQKVDSLEISNGKISGLHINNGDFLPATHVVLAIGHSARYIPDDS